MRRARKTRLEVEDLLKAQDDLEGYRRLFDTAWTVERERAKRDAVACEDGRLKHVESRTIALSLLSAGSPMRSRLMLT